MALVPQYKQTVISAATTGQGYADLSNYNYPVVYITSTAALSAGTLIIEESNDPGATVWSQVASVTLATPFASAGGVYADHLPTAAYAFVKCRIGTTVVGGTISVELRAN